jgi:hypothetical protein
MEGAVDDNSTDIPRAGLSGRRRHKLGLAITARAFLANGRPLTLLAALRATQAIYRFRRR